LEISLLVSDSFWKEILTVGKTKGKGTFGKVKSGTHEPTGEKVSNSFKIWNDN
jgi:hypothetical protein